jgi:hypothetical protein
MDSFFPPHAEIGVYTESRPDVLPVPGKWSGRVLGRGRLSPHNEL